jgi:hypothetical protein
MGSHVMMLLMNILIMYALRDDGLEHPIELTSQPLTLRHLKLLASGLKYFALWLLGCYLPIKLLANGCGMFTITINGRSDTSFHQFLRAIFFAHGGEIAFGLLQQRNATAVNSGTG